MDYFESSLPSAPVRYAFDDDESDSEAEAASSKSVTVDIGLTTPIPAEKCTLVVGLKGPGSVYLKALKKSGVAAGSLSIKSEDKDAKKFPILLLGQDILGLPFDEAIDDEQAYAIVKPVLNLVSERLKSVVVLDGLPSAEYMHTGDRENLLPPCTRILYSSAAQPVSQLEALEAPNMLKGLSAAFMTLCEVRSIACYTLVTMQEYYLGRPIVTLETVDAYVPALRKIGVDSAASNAADIEAVLKADHPGSANRLYL
ncbi:hypothetical protein BJV82DRAFT_576372 [Fennellomyces sp. T-0311]|nr:hypothetical protein BJV82DRAFT_576372 [Fennellomyces sp. T-0311]